jgi:hypothetical protein
VYAMRLLLLGSFSLSLFWCFLTGLIFLISKMISGPKINDLFFCLLHLHVHALLDDLWKLVLLGGEALIDTLILFSRGCPLCTTNH